MVLKLLGIEYACLLVHNVPGEVERVFGNFDILDLVEVLLLGADLVGVAQQRTDEPLLQRLERDDVLAVGENHAADRDLVHLPDGLPDHREGVVTDLAVGTQVVRTDQIARVDVGRVDELVDLDGPRRLQRQLLELLLGDLDVLSFVEFVAPDYVLIRYLVTGIGVDLHVLDPVTGRSIELIERDLFGFRCRRVEKVTRSRTRT